MGKNVFDLVLALQKNQRTHYCTVTPGAGSKHINNHFRVTINIFYGSTPSKKSNIEQLNFGLGLLKRVPVFFSKKSLHPSLLNCAVHDPTILP